MHEEVTIFGLSMLLYTLVIPFFTNLTWQECRSRTFLRFYFGRPRTYNCLLYVVRLVLCSFSLVWYFGCVLIELFFDKIFMPFTEIVVKFFNIFNCKRKNKQ